MPPRVKISDEKMTVGKCAKAGGVLVDGVCVIGISVAVIRGAPCQYPIWTIKPGDPPPEVMKSLIKAARKGMK